MTVLLLSSTILFILGISSFILNLLCISPELFGFVSSMTYENSFMRVPYGGSSLGAKERAQILRSVRVRVGDVPPRKPVGHIALASLEEDGEGAPISRLARHQKYD